MLTKFAMTRDINGYNGFGLPFSTANNSGQLIPTVEQTLIVPEPEDADYKNVLAIFSFQPGSLIWVALNETAEIAAGSISPTTSELNPAARYVKPGDVLHFICDVDSYAYGVVFYATK